MHLRREKQKCHTSSLDKNLKFLKKKTNRKILKLPPVALLILNALKKEEM